MRPLAAARIVAGVLVLAASFAGAESIPPRALCAYDGLCGDVNDSGGVTSADALLVLKKSVGQEVTLACAATGYPPYAVPLRSGQIECFDATGSEIDCAGSGQDGEFQAGFEPVFSEQGDGTILDKASGLQWEVLDRDLLSIHRMDASKTWEEAQAKVDALNADSFAGFSDWRLPNIRELQTLVAHGVRDPATHPTFDAACTDGCNLLGCSCTNPGYHWSSTTCLEVPNQAWSINFYAGETTRLPKANAATARAVRGGIVAKGLTYTDLTASILPSCVLAGPCGDVNESGTVSAPDALTVLQAAVGLDVTPRCPVTAIGSSAEVLRTGQTTCHDTAGTTIDCAGTGQDADFNYGVSPILVDNGDGTIADEGTGLVWEKLDAAPAGLHAQDAFGNWGQAFEKIAALNAASFAGHADWRLPNVRELQTLIRFGTFLPAVPAAFNADCGGSCTVTTCSCTPSNVFWTSTSSADDPAEAWFVDFYDGFAGPTPKSGFGITRAVRGGL